MKNILTILCTLLLSFTLFAEEAKKIDSSYTIQSDSNAAYLASVIFNNLNTNFHETLIKIRSRYNKFEKGMGDKEAYQTIVRSTNSFIYILANKVLKGRSEWYDVKRATKVFHKEYSVPQTSSRYYYPRRTYNPYTGKQRNLSALDSVVDQQADLVDSITDDNKEKKLLWTIFKKQLQRHLLKRFFGKNYLNIDVK